MATYDDLLLLIRFRMRLNNLLTILDVTTLLRTRPSCRTPHPGPNCRLMIPGSDSRWEFDDSLSGSIYHVRTGGRPRASQSRYLPLAIPRYVTWRQSSHMNPETIISIRRIGGPSHVQVPLRIIIRLQYFVAAHVVW